MVTINNLQWHTESFACWKRKSYNITWADDTHTTCHAGTLCCMILVLLQ